MKMHSFEMTPRDLLFLRDARPMEASDAGIGSNWPRPDQIYHALHAALLRKWPEVQPWESNDGKAHAMGTSKADVAGKNSSCRFGALKVFGPFPKKGDEIHLPCPLDIGMSVVECKGTNLPKPLTHAFLAGNQKKVSLPSWISVSLYEKYFDGTLSNEELEEINDAKLYAAERNIGIGIDAGTGSTVDGKLYQAEYLRLAKDVTLAFAAECEIKQRRGDTVTDVLQGDYLPKECVLGGQQGVAYIAESQKISLPKTEIKSIYLKWTLITPAIFKKGWLPGWLNDDGKVMLPRERVERLPGERRDDWKRRQNASGGFQTAKLIAARVGKPVAFSGWNLQSKQPKPTMLAVPAGSSYVFECSSIDEAKALAVILSCPNSRSDVFGEKGYGMGVCSSISLGTEA